MKYLLSLELRGLGSRDVEALSSYVHRLAHLHGVSASRLLKHASKCYEWNNQGGKQDNTTIGSNGNISALVRPNNYANYIFNIVSYCTGNTSIRSGTFLSLSLALDRSVQSFSARLRWCPVCMYEFEINNDPGYYKLLWHIEHISYCPDHMTSLIDKCPHCGAFQDGYGYKRICRECHKCGCGLGYIAAPTISRYRNELQSTDLIHLVEYISSNSSMTFPKDGVRGWIEGLTHADSSLREQYGVWYGISRGEYLNLTCGNESVTLDITRRFAYRLCVDLKDLLLGELSYTSGLLNYNWFKDLPEYLMPKKRRKQREKYNVEKSVKMLLFLQGDYSPPPLSDVSKSVGVSKGYLEYHFPKLSKSICQRYKEWRKKELVRKREQANAAATNYFSSIKYLHSRPSRKNALIQLREETGLPKNMLREEINKVYIKIFGFTKSQ